MFSGIFKVYRSSHTRIFLRFREGANMQNISFDIRRNLQVSYFERNNDRTLGFARQLDSVQSEPYLVASLPTIHVLTCCYLPPLNTYKVLTLHEAIPAGIVGSDSARYAISTRSWAVSRSREHQAMPTLLQFALC